MLPSLKLGIEWNPGADELAPLANWRALAETERRPALMFSTSTDRIGTPDGQSYTATVSKNLLPHARHAVAPYAGLAWSEHDGKLRGIGGLSVGLSPRWNALVVFDGVNVHPTLTFSAGPHSFTLLLTTGVREREDAAGRAYPGDGLAVGGAWSVVFGGRRAPAADHHDDGDEHAHEHGAEHAHEGEDDHHHDDDGHAH